MGIGHPWYPLGYVIAHLQTDMDAYPFYRVAPEGMMLVTTGLNGHSLEAVERELPAFWRAMHAVPLIEAQFGKPALLNILSAIWAALHAAGPRMRHRPDPRWGKLLASV